MACVKRLSLVILCLSWVPVLLAANNGCDADWPTTVANGTVECGHSGCRVRCIRGHRLEGSDRTLMCDYETGLIKNVDVHWRKNPPKCIPNCGRKGCQNGGTCVAPSKCFCAPGYTGNLCQTRLCPALVARNGSIVATATGLKVDCHPGFALRSGGSSTWAECQDRAWTVPSEDLENGEVVCRPDCDTPDCQNGGTCVAPQKCDCVPGFSGDRCQERTYLDIVAENGNISSSPTKLTVECHEGFTLRSGGETLEAESQPAGWKVPGEDMGNGKVVIVCVPDCGGSGCENGGICVSPGNCNCTAGYTGQMCQSRLCPDPVVLNGTVSGTPTLLKVECQKGFVLGSGESTIEAVCQAGGWTLPPGDIQDDKILCHPFCGLDGCENGGKCVAPHQCQCAQNFTGDRCQSLRCEEPSLRTSNASMTFDETHLVVECDVGYSFPKGGQVLVVPCNEGKWNLDEQTLKEGLIKCLPDDEICDYITKSFAFSYMKGDLSTQTLRCQRGYRMKDGKESVVLKCREGRWKVPDVGWMEDLDLNCYRE